MHYCQSYFEELVLAASSLNLLPLCGKKVLITGASGLICSVIVDVLMAANITFNSNIHLFLASRSEESISDRFAYYIEDPHIHFVQYDALKPVNFDFHVEYIIHGASNAHPAAYQKYPVETLLANVNGVKELLDYARNASVKRILYISSSEVYGNKVKSTPYCEDDYGVVDILNPRAAYPSGKRAAETLCIAYCAEYGVDSVIVRPGHIYGPSITKSDNRATAQFIRNVLNGEDILLKSSGTQLRSYCYVTDCVTAILTVLLMGKTGNAYNISNRNSIVSIRQMAEAFATTGGCSVIFSGASNEERKSYNLMENSSLNAEKLESLGWNAKYSIEEGTERTIRFLKE